MADKTNFSSELSKCKQRKSVLKVTTGDALAERYISFKTKTYCHLSYCASFAHLITLKTFFLNNSTCVHRNTRKLSKV